MAGSEHYLGMDRAALDTAYANHLVVPDRADYYARWQQRSDELRAERPELVDLAYGDAPRAKIDFFPIERPGAPVMAFIHGGYWQLNRKEGFAFVADALRPRGINAAVIGYTLGPQAAFGAIVDEIRAAVGWLHANSARLGADPSRLYVSGWSAGGHLAATVAGDERVRGVLTISGVFDLEPIRISSLNDALGLDAQTARRYSPLHTLPERSAPMIVTVGGAELPELRRQSRDFAAARAARKLPGGFVKLAGENHFSIMDQFAGPSGTISRLAAELVHD